MLAPSRGRRELFARAKILYLRSRARKKGFDGCSQLPARRVLKCAGVEPKLVESHFVRRASIVRLIADKRGQDWPPPPRLHEDPIDSDDSYCLRNSHPVIAGNEEQREPGGNFLNDVDLPSRRKRVGDPFQSLPNRRPLPKGRS